MEQYKGRSISLKIAAGPVFYYEKKQTRVKREHVEDTEAELRRLEEAKTAALEQLDRIYQKALKEAGQEDAAVFEVHKMLMEDKDYQESIRNIIEEQQVNAAYAAATAGDHFAAMLSEMEDVYMQARAADIRDVTERLVAALLGRDTDAADPDGPVILAAEDLAPSETVQMDKSKILAFVIRNGSANSHTAILARSMNIPAIMGVEVSREWNGRQAVVDGTAGTVVIDPDDSYLEEIRGKMAEETRRQTLLRELKGKPTVTKQGRAVRLYANIGNVTDIVNVQEYDAEGIGLFRSEFLYLGAKDFPTEEEQFLAYKQVAESMAGKKVIIRTLDIGADKKADYFQLEPEENPAMGYRAIRICLTRPEILKTQLRAILRASAYGNISVMFPMIISLGEVRKIKTIVEEVKGELKAAQFPYRDVELGVMIETPAAVLISRELAKEVDFFSIGTNDLTQYMLAADRQNPRLDAFYDGHHPAVLEAIRMVTENGHREGIWVGICGELAADLSLTKTFVDMGIDELSVAPGCVLQVREAIRELS